MSYHPTGETPEEAEELQRLQLEIARLDRRYYYLNLIEPLLYAIGLFAGWTVIRKK